MIRFLSLLMWTSGLVAQVGINTAAPNAALDINGDVIIRSIAVETDAALAKDYLLLSNGGLIKTIPLEDVFNETYKTMVKGNFSSGAPVNVSLLSGPGIIPFDNVEWDLNNEYDTSTFTFTANEEGIYEIEVYIKTIGIIVSNRFGLQLLKNNNVIHKNSYANISIGAVDVTPPVRSLRTQISLDANDTLTFELESSAAAVSTIENSEQESFFIIKRVR